MIFIENVYTGKSGKYVEFPTAKRLYMFGAHPSDIALDVK